jgi:hypothetical protein
MHVLVVAVLAPQRFKLIRVFEFEEAAWRAPKPCLRIGAKSLPFGEIAAQSSRH